MVATVPAWSGLAPVMPGHGSDGSGWVEVRRADGRSCGAARVPLVWMAADVRFDGDAATLPLVADWDLAACTIELAPSP